MIRGGKWGNEREQQKAHREEGGENCKHKCCEEERKSGTQLSHRKESGVKFKL